MAERKVKWTPEQLSAIELRDKTLLVSAAAGSGKTAVLTERIIKRLTDKNRPGDISRMLIVTFTKAAAGELKTRIAAAIGKAVAADPKNKYLKRQLLLLSSAKICTIHSFCLDVIKKNLKALGLPEGIGVANDVEMLLLRREVMNSVIDSAYRGECEFVEDTDVFLSLSDLFSSGGSDDGMCDSLFSFYDKLLSLPEGIDFLKRCADETLADSSSDFLDTAHGKIVAESLGRTALYILKKYRRAAENARADDTVFGKYAPVIDEDTAFLEALSDLLQGNSPSKAAPYFEAYSPSRLPSLPRGYASPLADAFKEVRDEFKIIYREKLKPLFEHNAKEYRELTESSSVLMSCLYGLLKAFDQAFMREKTNLARLDYSDIERYAYRALVHNGKPTETALEIRKSFDEVYIDEYQDTNSVQDRIFSAVSTETNRFMVGDIKQSIYGFRGAAPENFAAYRDRFPVYSERSADSAANTIFLSNNFRCDNTVVELCNTVFSCILKNTGGSVAYLDSDNLVCSKEGGKDNTVKAKVVLTKKKEDETESEYMCEAEYIANEAYRLISNEKNKDGTRVSPGDIAILVRANASSVEIEKALRERGVPTSNSIETEFFENPEILLVMALLNTIDNPMRDIYLAGVLKSPLFDFSLDDLVRVRAHDKNGTLYESLVSYTEKTGFEKGKYFLEKLRYFRSLAAGERADRLIKKLYRECAVFAAAAHNKPSSPSPEAARENLTLLYTYARDFEGGTYKGLNSFIRYVDDIIEKKTKLKSSSAKAPAGGSVRLMTVHQSKGLEFPVVFVAAAHKATDGRDKNPPLLTDSAVGASMDVPGPLPGSKIKTLHRRALEITMDNNRYEEEMRVLYVALTRARERLYITGEFKDTDVILGRAREAAENLCPHVIMQRLSYMQLVLTALCNADKLESEFCEVIYPKHSDFDTADQNAEADTYANENADEIIEKIKERISFVYPHAAALALPSKMSVSDLSHSALDAPEGPDISDSDKLCERTERIRRAVPDFTLGEKSASAAERGSATHEFMQFCDYKSAEELGADFEAARLVSRGFITEETAGLIDRAKVTKFFKSGFYKDKIKRAGKIWREYRFNADLPAYLFTTDPALGELYKNETLFVQGIIDCFAENPDGTLTLIDYKTDSIPPAMQNDEKAFEKLLKSRHTEQLAYYKYALEKLSKRTVKEVVIYSFALGREVDITDEVKRVLNG